jgi:hypothetical protein
VYYVRREGGEPSRSRPPTLPVPVAPPAPATDRTSAPIAVPGAVARERWLAARGAVPLVEPDDHTPPPIVFPPKPPDDMIVLYGRPSAAQLTAEIATRLALPGLRSLKIDINGAELLDDELVRVLRRARAAAWTAEIGFVVRATRPGALRWIARHGFGDHETTLHRFDTRKRPR